MKFPECKYPNTEMDLAELRPFPDVGFEGHGILVLNATFDYGKGGSQGLGYAIDSGFIEKFINVFGGSFLRECVGHVFVEHNNFQILRLIPANADRSSRRKEFDIKAYCKGQEKRKT